MDATVIPNRWTDPPQLRGEHVSLEPLQPYHVEGLRMAIADGRLWELWYTSTPHPDEMDTYVETALRSQAEGKSLAFVVRDAAGRIVGSTRYYHLDPDTPRVTIGYTWYARGLQRTGLNTEAKLLLLAHAFETLGCAAIGFETSWFNQRSRTAIERLGAKRDGVLRNHLRHRDGSLRDTVVYSILDTEWPSVRRHLRDRLAEHAHG